MISIKPVPKNPITSIRDNLDPNSNEIEENDLQKEKHSSPNNTTLTGILINSTFVF
jgi:hypothetical protein